VTPLDTIVREQIERDGPMPYGDVVELALYHPEYGFYTSGGHAGRRGDFITSPEVGPLFGQVIANALDAEWRRLDEPDRFVVIDWGAGPGTLLRSILAATPACMDALDLVAVERSVAQRELHPEGITSVGEVADGEFAGQIGCIIANELLDNLAFTPVQRFGDDLAYEDVVAGPNPQDRLITQGRTGEPPDVRWYSPGVERAVDQTAAADWLTVALNTLEEGRVIVFDYARAQSDEVHIRTYAEHGHAGDPLRQLGSKDITVDVDLFQLQARVRRADTLTVQASWLRRHGLDTLVEQGRRVWEAKAATGSIEALRARSRIREAEALTEMDGLGGFSVAEWSI